jgi:acetyl-CoA acetyltransferase
MLEIAAGLIEVGICNVVCITMADKLATGLGRDATIESMATIGHPQFEAPFGPMIPALYALFAQRWMWQYRIEPEHVAMASVNDRFHAALHPLAQYRAPLTVADVLGSRLIADPLHMLECAPISDGGGAIVVTSPERARALATRPVYLLGIGEAHEHEHVSQARSLVETGAAVSGPAAFAMAGMQQQDIDVAMIYDPFSFVQCMHLEDLGFCAKGDGAAFVASGATRLGGSLPVNTHGGMLSHSHPGRPSALFLIVEAIRQLRGECGERQVAGARTALVHAEGGILSSHCTAIFGSEVS